MADRVTRKLIGRIGIDILDVSIRLRVYRQQGTVKGEEFSSFRIVGHGLNNGDTNLKRLIRSTLASLLSQ
jgi:hypothetical protein